MFSDKDFLHNPRLVDDIASALLAEEMAARESRVMKIPRGVIAGFPSLDDELGGYLTPGLHILMGTPGAGKTAFALQLAAQCGFPCLYASAEMRPIELLRRVIARVTETHIGYLRGGELAESVLNDLIARTSAACPMLALHDATSPGADTIREATARLQERFESRHALIVLDSLTDWVARGAGGKSGATEECAVIEEALTELKQVARQLVCPLLVLAHWNRLRGDEGMRRVKYTLEYISESLWSLEPTLHADGITGMKLSLLKNRHGASGRSLDFTFEGGFQRFYEGVVVDLPEGSEGLAMCREVTQEIASRMGFRGQDLWGIVSAVFEACSNALTHGRKKEQGAVVLILQRLDDRLEVVVKDSGKGFSVPESIAMPPISSVHGRGLPLMKTFMDEMKVDNANGCTVKMVKYAQGPHEGNLLSYKPN
ncbi:MAG: ATP-binding protein [Armatimonadetes bacterium]|nr:ATP-binding protein [Armatimonadota bacterium]